ncbi:hypothetical protein PC117_g4969 [Phytophthora cactorum]|uniref:Uncharacterized protein n=1 Tax=Phytophthora cactorum TaxID=29920 RepID=A0A8T1E8C0_9STRA|nr:hypothetical protein PC117_g4969 [Phytophthora cactorum]
MRKDNFNLSAKTPGNVAARYFCRWPTLVEYWKHPRALLARSLWRRRSVAWTDPVRLLKRILLNTITIGSFGPTDFQYFVLKRPCRNASPMTKLIVGPSAETLHRIRSLRKSATALYGGQTAPLREQQATRNRVDHSQPMQVAGRLLLQAVVCRLAATPHFRP